jgi:adenosylcobinamide-phosphate synthase
MHLVSNAELTLSALILEAVVGYPDFVYRAIGHPVTWAGALLAWLEVRLNRAGRFGYARGVLALTVLVAFSAAVSVALERLFSLHAAGALVLVLAASTLLAQRSLHEHVRAVAEALDVGGLEAGRRAVSLIVGRNPAYLDEAGVVRAAIESLAENFSDGVIAPAFWLAVGGLPGGACYKAINTADSMIGHRTPRHTAFGWAAARLVNLPASRLSALFVIAGASAVGASPVGAIRAVWRDASRHRSPNAGWPESAMAGALGLRLAGPRVYGETLVEDAFMGDGRRDASAADIRRALRVYRAACVVPWVLLAVIALCATGHPG